MGEFCLKKKKIKYLFFFSTKYTRIQFFFVLFIDFKLKKQQHKMPSKEGEQMLILESENISSCSGGFESKNSPTTQKTTTTTTTTIQLQPTQQQILFKKSMQSIKIKNFKNLNNNINNNFNEEDFLNGISFDAKVIFKIKQKKQQKLLRQYIYFFFRSVYWFIRCGKA